MRTLHLLRHAKSAWDIEGQPDRERGLSRRGRRDAPRMGRALATRLAPMTVHASTARRAQLTLRGLCEGWPALGDIVHESVEELYTFSGEDVRHWISSCSPASSALFVLGHNPGLTDLVNELVGRHILDNLPTAGYVELRLDIDHWGALRHGCAELSDRLFPRELPED